MGFFFCFSYKLITINQRLYVPILQSQLCVRDATAPPGGDSPGRPASGAGLLAGLLDQAEPS